MLQAQKDRFEKAARSARVMRRILLSHFVLGALVVCLFLAHGLLSCALAAFLGYLLTVLTTIGIIAHQDICRICLGFIFISFALWGAYYLTQISPSLDSKAERLLSLDWLKHWLGAVDLAYLAGGVAMIRSRRLKHAVTFGFRLW